jgi:hypothetical protein
MSETRQLILTLKKQLKIQGRTYRDVASALNLSEPSVKRLFASGRFTVERMIQVSNFLGFTLAELAKQAINEQPRLCTLTEKQERELVSDPKQLLIAVCALNQWAPEEIVTYYRISETDCIKYLLRLDTLRIIDLLPGNRIRLNVARDFDWLPYGPIKQYFQERGQSDFLRSKFSAEGEAMAFVHGMFSDQATAQILGEIRRLRQRFAELHEESLSAPLSKRRGMALLLALRGWEPADFAALRR